MRSLSLFYFCLAMLFSQMTGQASAAEKLKIIVGGDHANPPYEFLENGKPSGFNVELMRAAAEAAGADVEFRLGPWNDVRRELEQGKIDALAGMYYSEERGKEVDFSVPHTMVTAGLFVRRDSRIRSIQDIKAKEVIVQKGDVINDYLRKEGIASRLIEVKDPADVLRLLASGRHDCALMPSRFQGEYLVRVLGISNVRAISADLPQLRYCFAVKKGNSTLKYRLDEGLDILKINGRYEDIYEKWFGVYEKGRLWRTIWYFIWALAIIAGLLVASSIWSWFLRREVRKRTDELRESEERMRFTQFAVDNTIDQAFWMTEDGRFFYVNDAACNALGYTREELSLMSIPDIDPIFQPGKFAEHWRDLRENGYATFESSHRAKDGRVYPVEIRANYVVFDGKEYNCAFATDITERKRVEEELRRAHDELEKRVVERTVELRRANELLEEEICARNRTERVITARLRLLEFSASHSLDDLLEATINEAEALTGSVIGFFHFLEADQETLSLQSWSTRTKAEFCKVEGKGLHYDVSLAGVWTDCIHARRPVIHNDYASLSHRRGMPPDHTQVFRELVLPVFRGDSIVAIIGVGNKPEDYISEDVEAISFLADIAWEITERKQAEESLRRAKEEWERTFDSVPDLIAILDDRHRVARVNKAMAKRLGLNPEECVGLHCYEAMHGLSESPPFCPHTQTLMDGREHVVEIHEERLGGDFLVSTIPLNDERGVMVGAVHIAYDITERKRAEQALKESEARVRRKLESILDPEGDIGELELADILDAPGIQALMDDFYRNTGIKMSIIDLKGRVLVDVGWQDICLKFHRGHPETRKKCLISDTVLTEGVPRGLFRRYHCKNNMWHLVTPIFVGDRHMGNLFLGQFFFDNEELDYGLFRAQAREYGFPEEEYIAALEAVPRRSEECVNSAKAFFLRLIDMFSKLSYGNIKLARSLAERDRLTARLREANMVVENSPVVLFRCKAAPGWPVELVSGNVVQFGYTPEEFLSGDITYSSIVYPQDLPGLAAETEEFSATGKEQWLQEYRIVTKGGEIRWIIDETDCIRNEKGEVTHYEGVVIDVTERKLAEEQLRENLLLLQTMMRNSPIVLYGIDRNGVFTLSEGKGLAGMGLKPGEIVGRSAFDVYRGMPEHLGNFRRALAGESFVAPVHAGDHIYDAYHEPMYDDDGDYDGTLGVLVDVTEQRRAEEALREANLVVENSPVVLFRWQGDDEWPVELVSGNIIQFGYTPDEFLSRSITYSSIIHPDDLERVTREVHDFCNDGADQFRLEYRIFTKGRNVRWVNELTNVERDTEGRVRNYEGVVIDVTERRLAEEEIRESRAKYQAIVDSFDGLIYSCSQDCRIEFMNRKLIERTGRDATGELCYKVMHERDSVCPWCVNDRVFAGETVHREMFSPKDSRWYHVVNIPIRHADGSMSKHSMMFDITDRKLFEEKLQKQKELLEDLNRTLAERVRAEVTNNREKDVMLIQQNRQAALGEILDHIAHQWKQPLNTISLITYLLKEDESLSKAEVGDIADKILEQVEHMSQTLKVFRDFYRPDKEKSAFLVKESIARAISFIEIALQVESVRIDFEAEPKLAAEGYPKEFAQVILNLLSNAREAFREKKVERPELIIRAFAEEDMVVVTVTDNGGGICEANLGSIFDLNFTTKLESGGTGVGLYMSKNIVERHMGGTLTAANVKGGARFTIRLKSAAPGVIAGG